VSPGLNAFVLLARASARQPRRVTIQIRRKFNLRLSTIYNMPYGNLTAIWHHHEHKKKRSLGASLYQFPTPYVPRNCFFSFTRLCTLIIFRDVLGASRVQNVVALRFNIASHRDGDLWETKRMKRFLRCSTFENIAT
jgi:hypothetical protein